MIDPKRYSNIPFAPAKCPFFYGWVIVFVATVGTICSIPGQTIGFSVFTNYVKDALLVNEITLTSSYMIGTVASSFFLVKVGRLYDKFGARLIGTVSALFLGVTLLFMSRIDDFVFFIESKYITINHFSLVLITTSISFFFLRFLAQGVLTLVSRSMIQQWFVQRRGLANGIAGVFIAFSFAIAPKVTNSMIEHLDWKGAWALMGSLMILLLVPFILIFYRDTPEECKLLPDNCIGTQRRLNKQMSKSYTLNDAKRTPLFWLYTLSLSYGALFITGFTFNLVSVFAEFGFSQNVAVSIFIPSGVIAIVMNLFTGWLSDKIKMKYILLLYLFGEILLSIGILSLDFKTGMYLIILGNGISGGIFGILISASFPKFFGKEHLGEVIGLCMSTLVVGSAIGPFLFSTFKLLFNSYKSSSFVMIIIAIGLIVATIKIKEETVNHGNP